MPISHRLIGNPFFTKLAKIFYGVPFNDIYCGMKIFNRNFYNKISNYNLDLNQKYIVCALQYQPEKSTCPLGSRYSNQFLMIKKLRNFFPKNIKIFVWSYNKNFTCRKYFCKLR